MVLGKRALSVPWAELGRFDHEIRGVKKHGSGQTDSKGRRQVELGYGATADTSSDRRLQLALQRRGVAMEIARLMTYEKHQEMVALFFQEVKRDRLPGHQKVSLDQAGRADAEISTRLAELYKG